MEEYTQNKLQITLPMSRPTCVLFKQGAYTGCEKKTQNQPVLIHFKSMPSDKQVTEYRAMDGGHLSSFVTEEK